MRRISKVDSEAGAGHSLGRAGATIGTTPRNFGITEFICQRILRILRLWLALPRPYAPHVVSRLFDAGNNSALSS